MKFSENWLRTFVNPPLASADLAELLTMSGVEVEALEPAAPFFRQGGVAQVLSVKKHAGADRLSLCESAWAQARAQHCLRRAECESGNQSSVRAGGRPAAGPYHQKNQECGRRNPRHALFGARIGLSEESSGCLRCRKMRR